MPASLILLEAKLHDLMHSLYRNRQALLRFQAIISASSNPPAMSLVDMGDILAAVRAQERIIMELQQHVADSRRDVKSNLV